MEEETEKRDKLILGIVTERYRLEWQRTNDLNGKASSLAGFSGVMATLHSGILRVFIAELSLYSINLYLSFIPLIFLGLSFFLALSAYWVKTWEAIEPKSLIERYKDKEYEVVMRTVATTISDMTMKNHEINTKKVKFLKCSLIILALGVVSIFIVPALSI